MKASHCLMPLLLVLFGGCSSAGQKKAPSTGRPYEVVVVCPRGVWEGVAGDTLRAILLAPVEMINQREPLFDVCHMLPAGMGNFAKRHRNTLVVGIGPEYSRPGIGVRRDLFSMPQMVVSVTGPDQSSVAEHLSCCRAALVEMIGQSEHERYAATARKNSARNLEELIEGKFGFKMTIPRGYALRNKSKDFLWLSSEHPQASQGIVIYRYPCSGKGDLEPETLVARRNEHLARIPGPSEGSYMTTAAEFPPSVERVCIGLRQWTCIRGFWDVAGDFMGGPFVGCSSVDSSTRSVVSVDCYVFSPKEHKRNYLRELEALVLSVRFPGDSLALKE
ncbi:DUF4837 domain-containing protein [Bacteroidia bacterium]|nr:DUF4837 domain-containing protein [Bacteroidia bacterium]